MKLLPESRIVKLTTKRLLAYRDALLRCHETQDWDISYPSPSQKIAKDTAEWKETYRLVKSVLATREHVPRKKHK